MKKIKVKCYMCGKRINATKLAYTKKIKLDDIHYFCDKCLPKSIDFIKGARDINVERCSDKKYYKQIIQEQKWKEQDERKYWSSCRVCGTSILWYGDGKDEFEDLCIRCIGPNNKKYKKQLKILKRLR